MIEGLTDEVLTIVERSLAGLSLAEIYRQSELADSEQAVAGALHRLTSRGDLAKSTDKRYRTPQHVKKERVTLSQPDAKTEGDSRPKATKKKVARKKAPAKRSGTANYSGNYSGQSKGNAPVLPESWIEDLEQASVDSQVRLDRYLSQVDDPLLDYLIEAASAAKSVAEAARRVADGGEP